MLGLDVMLNVDRINPANTNIAIEISSAIGGGIKDVLFAVYIYNARIIIDMRAIGLRAYEIRNLEYVVDLQKQLFELIDGLVGSLEVDISELLNGLIKPDPSVVATQDNLNSDETLGEADTAISIRMVNSHNAAGERVTTVKWNAVNGADSYRLTMPDADGNETIFTCADTYYSFVSDADVYTKPYNVKVEALDADGTPISESVRGANGVIASLLNAISLQNSIIRLDVTSEILDTILATLLPNVSINMDPLELLQAKVDIFNGNANARIDLVIKQSDTGAVVNEFNLGATLSLKMADKLYSVDELTGNPDPDTVIQQAITGMGSNGLNIVDLGQGDMAGRIVNALLTAVGTTSLKAEIAVGFNAGTYDLAALI
ncbi:MAG: hypothetical protein K2I79_04555, partial [Clostridia bacterium]|nr:hypothetical protein [Clostridia bacterium]